MIGQGIHYHSLECNYCMGKLQFSKCLRCGSERKTNVQENKLRCISRSKICLFTKERKEV